MYLIRFAPLVFVICLCLGDTSKLNIYFCSTIKFSLLNNRSISDVNNNINLHLKRFSKVNFDVEKLKQHHERVRRSVTRNIKLSFEAHGRYIISTFFSNFQHEYLNLFLLKKI